MHPCGPMRSAVGCLANHHKDWVLWISGVTPAKMSSATPGPIPIVRAGDNGQANVSEGTPLARQSSSGSYLGLSASLGGGSFKEAMALSFGKDVAEYVMAQSN